jgi:hypothetical protein
VDFNYSEIRWCPYQCIWIISKAETLRTGEWEILDDNIGARNTPHEGRFVNAINVLAELEIRLAATGKDGEKLQEQVLEGRTFSNISPRARSALMFVKGWRRKRISYSRWVREIYLHPRQKTVANLGAIPVK